MHARDFSWRAAALAALAVTAHAQQLCSPAQCAPQPPAATNAAPTGLGEWRIAIHTAPADPVGGEYGTWAAGPNYKVSFRDGFAFYPVLGAHCPRNLPLRWRTASIAVGGEAIVEDGAAARHVRTDWRYEYHYLGTDVVEGYDVRRDGVEQTFTLLARPPGRGDLVISGAVDTELVCDDAAPRHGALVFRDGAGTPRVEYGAALALDARGDRVAVRTAFASGRISLTVDGAWLDRARFPVVVDPLASSLGYANVGTPDTVDVARDGETDQLFYASDPTPGFAGRLSIFLNPFFDSQWPCVSKVSDGGSASWVVAWQSLGPLAGDDGTSWRSASSPTPPLPRRPSSATAPSTVSDPRSMADRDASWSPTPRRRTPAATRTRRPAKQSWSSASTGRTMPSIRRSKRRSRWRASSCRAARRRRQPRRGL